ncbi:hypothetical protein AltI4_33510 [Alteromonas sp. I4]|nr:hypothetical protein AltI4_33510 [Alteromonas sp. I4]
MIENRNVKKTTIFAIKKLKESAFKVKWPLKEIIINNKIANTTDQPRFKKYV